jgi:hypothetical protein
MIEEPGQQVGVAFGHQDAVLGGVVAGEELDAPQRNPGQHTPDADGRKGAIESLGAGAGQDQQRHIMKEDAVVIDEPEMTKERMVGELIGYHPVPFRRQSLKGGKIMRQIDARIHGPLLVRRKAVIVDGIKDEWREFIAMSAGRRRHGYAPPPAP